MTFLALLSHPFSITSIASCTANDELIFFFVPSLSYYGSIDGFIKECSLKLVSTVIGHIIVISTSLPTSILKDS